MIKLEFISCMNWVTFSDVSGLIETTELYVTYIKLLCNLMPNASQINNCSSF